MIEYTNKKKHFSFSFQDSSTIDCNVEFVQLYSDVTSVISVVVSDKIINNSDNFRSYSKTSAMLCILYFLFLHFLFNIKKHFN